MAKKKLTMADALRDHKLVEEAMPEEIKESLVDCAKQMQEAASVIYERMEEWYDRLRRALKGSVLVPNDMYMGLNVHGLMSASPFKSRQDMLDEIYRVYGDRFSRQTLHAYEAGNTVIPANRLLEIASVMNTTTDKLLSRQQKATSKDFLIYIPKMPMDKSLESLGETELEIEYLDKNFIGVQDAFAVDMPPYTRFLGVNKRCTVFMTEDLSGITRELDEMTVFMHSEYGGKDKKEIIPVKDGYFSVIKNQEKRGAGIKRATFSINDSNGNEMIRTISEIKRLVKYRVIQIVCR